MRDLSGTGLDDRPPPSFSPDQFAAFLKSKVEAIRRELSPFLNTVSRAELSSAPSCPVTFDSFQPVTPDTVAKVLDRCRATTSSLDPCPAWLIKAARPITTESVSYTHLTLPTKA